MCIENVKRILVDVICCTITEDCPVYLCCLSYTIGQKKKGERDTSGCRLHLRVILDYVEREYYR